MKDVEVEGKEQKIDPIKIAIDTPKEKMPQFTVIPIGGIVPFAMSKTIQQFGKKDAFNGETEMEYFLDRIFEYSRSKGGMMLGGLLRLAQTKAESTADEEADVKRLKF